MQTQSPFSFAAAPARLAPSEQSGAYLLHLSPLLGLMLPSIGHLLGPIAAWLMLKESPALSAEGKEVVNFQLTVTLVSVVLSGLVFVFFGLGMFGGLLATLDPLLGPLGGLFLILLRLWGLIAVYPFIFMVVGLVKAANGEFYRYPLTIRFLR